MARPLPLTLALLSLAPFWSTPLASAESAPGYDATLYPVMEVCLRGTSRLDPWVEILGEEGLTPLRAQGGALMDICVFRWSSKGRERSEAVVSVYVEEPEGEAAFVVWGGRAGGRAARVERRGGKAPYQHLEIAQVNQGPLSSFAIKRSGEVVFAGSIGGPRAPSREEILDWEGRVYLPSHRTRRGKAGRSYQRYIGGAVAIYPFIEGADTFEMGPLDYAPMDEWMAEPGAFEPMEWWIRIDGTQAKGRP